MAGTIVTSGSVSQLDSPVIGPADGAAFVILTVGVTATAVAASGIYLYDQATTSGEDVEESEEVENNPEQSGRYDESNDRVEDDDSGRRGDHIPRRPPPDVEKLLPDGEEEDHPDGYEDLRQQGIPEETVEEWEEDGHDLERMSDGLERYRQSGKTISKDAPAGDLAEILAKPKVKEEFPSNSRLVSSVDLDDEYGSDKGEFDYVVLDPSGEVIGVVEVKHANDDASKAKQQTRDGLRAINDGYVDSVSDDITTEDFTESDNIDQLWVDPYSDKQRVEKSKIPEHSLTTYDKHLRMTQDEFKDLSKWILEGGSNE